MDQMVFVILTFRKIAFYILNKKWFFRKMSRNTKLNYAPTPKAGFV